MVNEEFDIHIKDNFLEKNIYQEIYKKIPFYTYSENVYRYTSSEGIRDKNHLFYGAVVEEDISNYIRKKCEKLYNKKFKEKHTSYTMVARTTPMVHRDIGEKTTHQIIIYIRGNERLNKGTGFYSNGELNTHVGFKQNRAIFWESSVFHSPLTWNDNQKGARFSIIAQYKEI